MAEEKSKKASPAEGNHDRINRIYKEVLGRNADEGGAKTYAKLSDDQLRSELKRSLEYQEKAGKLKVIRSDGKRQTVAFFDDSLFNDKEWMKGRWGPGDVLIRPKGSSTPSGELWGGGQEKTALTEQDLADPRNEWLKTAGYGVGDKVLYAARGSGAHGGLVDALDTVGLGDAARKVVSWVPAQLAAVMDPFGIQSGMISRELAQKNQVGARRLTGLDDTEIGYLRAAGQVALVIGTGGTAAPAVAAMQAQRAMSNYAIGTEGYGMKSMLADVGVSAVSAGVAPGLQGAATVYGASAVGGLVKGESIGDVARGAAWNAAGSISGGTSNFARPLVDKGYARDARGNIDWLTVSLDSAPAMASAMRSGAPGESWGAFSSFGSFKKRAAANFQAVRPDKAANWYRAPEMVYSTDPSSPDYIGKPVSDVERKGLSKSNLAAVDRTREYVAAVGQEPISPQGIVDYANQEGGRAHVSLNNPTEVRVRARDFQPGVLAQGFGSLYALPVRAVSSGMRQLGRLPSLWSNSGTGARAQ